MPTRAELVTPERVLYSGEAGFVVLRTDGGEIMFLPHHTDFVGAVDICVVRIAPAGADETEASGPEVRAAVAGGFVHVADNTVTVLASVAELADEIDVARARRALEAAEAEETTGEGHREGPREAPAHATGEEHAAEGHAAGEVVAGPTMLALLQPELAEVRARRARARLEAAGEVDASQAGAQSH